MPVPQIARIPVRIALAAFLAVPLNARMADAESYQAIFDFRISGIRAGEIAMSGEDGGGSYRARAEVRTAGLVSILADFFYDGNSAGRVASNGRVIPERFLANSKSPRDTRETRIDWKQGTPVSVSVEPPRSSAPEPSSQAGTLDPVSASFALLRDMPAGEICRKSVDVFDGSRRSRITLGTPQADGGDLICNGSYERLEGEGNSFNASSSYGFRLIYQQGADGTARLDRIETRTDFGMAALVRK